jgi:gluconate 2-dehydrogenase gamma chain
VSDGMDRRAALSALSVGMLGAYGVGTPSWQRFTRLLSGGGSTAFFSPEETALVAALADLIIPKDDRSGSATEAGSVPYMDFVLSESGPRTQAAWHAGLRWFDDECRRRFGQPFLQCGEAERAQVLDDIAWPARARPEHAEAAAFFNRLRDLTAAAFFSSAMGVADLRYEGNVFNPEWRGAPQRALDELGVSYVEWDRRYGGLQ